MLTAIVPKIPMRNKQITKTYYIDQLGFQNVGSTDFDGYLMLKKDGIEIHFFEFKDLNPLKNYGQVYIRTENIKQFYQELTSKNVTIHPNGALQLKP